jgi:hypothetical protein
MTEAPYDFAREDREALAAVDRVVWVGTHAYEVDDLPSPSDLRDE